MAMPVNRAIRIIAVFGVSILMTTMCRTSKTSPPAARVDTVFSVLISEREPGAAVLVLESGRAVLARGYGVTDLRTRSPIGAETNFRLASVTKQFTAAAIMLLVRDGRLCFDDTLADIFPDFPPYGRGIAVRQLLNHTSGLPDYEDLMTAADPSAPMEQTQIRDAGVLELLERQTAGRFPPGTRWAYSNSGYVVLGLVVEKVSGRPFGEFLHDRIFAPLKMTNTIAYERGKNRVRNRAYGHSREAAAWQETDQSPTSATLGDGGVYSSLLDLAKWDEALRTHALLSEAEMRPALTPVRVPNGRPEEPGGTPADYGFGWFLNPWKGHSRMWHYGETIGFRTAIQRFVGDGLTVVVLGNRADLDASALALKVAGFYLNEGG
jgi:CubicO group peptidase (beta-lactamase class C family)